MWKIHTGTNHAWTSLQKMLSAVHVNEKQTRATWNHSTLLTSRPRISMTSSVFTKPTQALMWLSRINKQLFVWVKQTRWPGWVNCRYMYVMNSTCVYVSSALMSADLIKGPHRSALCKADEIHCTLNMKATCHIMNIFQGERMNCGDWLQSADERLGARRLWEDRTQSWRHSRVQINKTKHTLLRLHM